MRFPILVVSLTAITTPAVAGGFSTARFGGEHGHAATDHPTALYYNPAGLALSTGHRLYVEGLFALRTAKYVRPPEAIDNVVDSGETGTGTPDTAVSANAGAAELTNVVASPFAAVVSDFGVDGLAVGAGVYVPFGGSAEWDKNENFEDNQMFPGAVDGVQRWANINGEQSALYGTVAGAYRFEPLRLSVGVGLNLVRQEVATVRARNVTGTDDLVSGSGAIVEGRTLIEVSDTTLSLGGGVIWEPADRVWVGLSYQSQPGFGERGLTGTLDNKFGTNPPMQSNVELTQELPDVVRFAARTRFDRAELRLAADYQRWSVYDRQCVLDAGLPDRNCSVQDNGSPAADGAGIILVIPRNFDDTWGARVGGSYWVRPELELAAGVGYDSNAIPDATIDPALMDMDKIISTLGAVYSLPAQGLGVRLSFTNVLYFGRDVAPREADLMSPSRNPDMAGEYSQSVNLLTLGLQYRL